MDFLRQSLSANFSSDDNLRILVPKRNSGNFTYDGIEVGAERVMREVEEHIAHLKDVEGLEVSKISIIGYSLGGLVARYVVGLMGHYGWFDRIEPVVRMFCEE